MVTIVLIPLKGCLFSFASGLLVGAAIVAEIIDKEYSYFVGTLVGGVGMQPHGVNTI